MCIKIGEIAVISWWGKKGVLIDEIIVIKTPIVNMSEYVLGFINWNTQGQFILPEGLLERQNYRYDEMVVTKFSKKKMIIRRLRVLEFSLNVWLTPNNGKKVRNVRNRWGFHKYIPQHLMTYLWRHTKWLHLSITTLHLIQYCNVRRIEHWYQKEYIDM